MSDPGVRPYTGDIGKVIAVAYAPDGATLASGGGDGTVRIWDTRTGHQLRQLTGHAIGVVGSVAYAPDGATLASGSLNDGSVRIWDARTGQQLHQLTGHTAPILPVAYAPNGATLASGDMSGVRIWDARTGQQRHLLTGHDGPVLSVAFAPDGAALASGGDDPSVRIWGRAGRQLRQLTGHTGWVISLAYAPDSATLASGDYECIVRIWDARTGQQLHQLTGHDGPVSWVAFAPDGATLASVDMNCVRIWDARTGQQLHQLTVPGGWPGSVAFAPDGAALASGGETTIWFWNPRSGAQIDGTSDRGGLGPAEAGYVRKCLEPQFREEREDRRWDSPGVVEVITLLNSGENRECARAAEVKAAENSDLDLYYDWGGTAYLRMKEYELARRILLKGLAKGKRKSGNCNVMGEVEWKAGNAKEATYWWIQAVHCQESIKDDTQESPYLYLHYVADGLGLADVAAAFIGCVDHIRAGGIRLSPASAADLTNFVRQQATPGMRHVVTAVRDRYLKPSPPAKEELSQPEQKLSLLLRQIESQLKSRPNPAFPMVSLGLHTTELGRKVVWCLSTSYDEPAVMDPSAAASFLNQELQTIGVTVSSGGWTEGPGSDVNHQFDYEFLAAAPNVSSPQPTQAATTPAGAWSGLGAVVDLRSVEERKMAERSQSEHERIAHELGVADLTGELTSLVREDNSGFANRARIREIGEELYRRGGHNLMQEAYYHVSSADIYFSQDIWDRIGEWQA